jgi:SAM-dependent methyltransferase
MAGREFDSGFQPISKELRELGLEYEQQYRYALLRHLGTPDKIKEATFLDIGSGIGNPLQDLVMDYGARVVCLDLDPDTVYEAASSGTRAIQGDMFSTPFRSGSFDGVLCSEVIDIVPKNAEQLRKIFQEVHRVLKNGGVFLQRHIGTGIPIGFPDAKDQLEILAQTGFGHIYLLERPTTVNQLAFSAVSVSDAYVPDEALKSNFAWVYREIRSDDSGFGVRPRDVRNMIERDDLDYWGINTIKRNLTDALTNEKPLLLLNCIRSAIIQFWSESNEYPTPFDVAVDFDYQYLQYYPQFTDVDYCQEHGLDASIAKHYYQRWGLTDIIEGWKQGRETEFRFFGKGPYEKIVFDPVAKTMKYLGDPNDPEGQALRNRFVNIFGQDGLQVKE